MKKINIILFSLFFHFVLVAQTMVKMAMPKQPDEKLNVLTLYDEKLPLNSTIVLGAIGYSIAGGTAPYTLEWLKDNQVFATGDIAVIQPVVGSSYALKVIDKNNCFYIVSINIDANSSLPQNMNKLVLVTPTIVSDQVTVSFVENQNEKAIVRFYNDLGVLKQQNSINGNSVIPVNLRRGIYYVVINDGKSYFSEKIIVQ